MVVLRTSFMHALSISAACRAVTATLLVAAGCMALTDAATGLESCGRHLHTFVLIGSGTLGASDRAMMTRTS